MNKHYKTLDYYEILEQLSGHALSHGGKTMAENLQPYNNINIVKEKLQETSDGKTLIDKMGSPPIFTMQEIYNIDGIIKKGDMLTPSLLREISSFISSCNRMKSYLKRAMYLELPLTTWHESLVDLDFLKSEIDSMIHGDQVSSNATPNLANISRKIIFVNNQIRNKLDSLLSTNKQYLSDNLVVKRGDRYALPVKKEYKNKITGSVIDVSRAGSTCYIEPKAVTKLQDELSILKIDEDNEIRKILYTLTALVEENFRSISLNMDQMEKLDFIFSKSKLSLEYNGVAAEIHKSRIISIVDGRHPLLPKNEVVPLNIELDNKGLIITGPNTGGKTVTLKTVGLFTLLTQSGLHIPAKSGILPLTDNVLCDIGDGQSIEENLSTFSSHMKNIISILHTSTSDSLILLDELGSGTDPDEGMGLAIAILDELMIKKSLVLCTTHYPEVKSFCDKSQEYINGSMAFDKENLKPLYQLVIGTHGESCAIYIAKRLGLSENILEKARVIANSKEIRNIKVDGIIESNNKAMVVKSKIIKDKQKLENTLPQDSFDIGDSVEIPKKGIGIVCEKADKYGDVTVFYKGEKLKVNYKRLILKVKSHELYPADYDFSIIFDSVENRKIRRIHEKRHDPTAIINN
ncbi:MAG: endonuclease MutS2 [Lachnospirales bacterium]